MVGSLPETDLEWMALAQHHRLNTRLLDWTESLLVAAMFATESGVTFLRDIQTGEQKRSPPAIYGIRNLPEAKKDEEPFGVKEVKVFRPAHISPRIAPQQAVFTVHPRPEEKFDSDDLVRWTLDIHGTIEMSLLWTRWVSQGPPCSPELTG
jgi:FRG domain